MLVWTLIAAMAAICCAALIYAGRARPVNVGPATDAQAERGHQRSLLAEIDTDLAAGRISPADATAAKAELAREVMRSEKAEAPPEPDAAKTGFAGLTIAASVVAAGLGVAVYAYVGNPQLPAAPLASRDAPQQAGLNLDEAVAKVEAQMARTPDDVRGWRVLGPVYMRSGRYEDAVNAFRKVLALAPPTADAETDLAEALMMANAGNAGAEADELLQKAQSLEPGHPRSLFYLAGEAMRQKDFKTATTRWQQLIDNAKGDEPWLPVAKQGLEMAKSGTNTPPAATTGTSQQEMIRNMVESLTARLQDDGGTLAEWTQLIRSRLVLGERDKAQAAYDAARKAYPNAADRTDLDAFAAENGLTGN